MEVQEQSRAEQSRAEQRERERERIYYCKYY